MKEEKETLAGKTGKKKRYVWIVLIVILALLGGIAFQTNRQLKTLYTMAKEAKQNALDSVSLFFDEEYDASQRKLNKAHETLKYFRSFAENEFVYDMGCRFKKYSDDFKAACALMDIADETLDKWTDRTYDLVREYSLKEIVREDGYDIRAILAYLNFAEDLVPEAERLLPEVCSIKLSFFDIEGAVSEHQDKIDELLSLYHRAEYYLPLLHAVLGDGSDKLFLIAAQNTAEIRPGGGFPGSMGTVTIKDGILSIGDFDSVWSVMPANTPSHLMPSSSMNSLFGGVLVWPRDAEFCPDFEWLGKFWADVYEYKYGVAPDAVFSVTPAIIQEFLKIAGEIQVSNGDVVDGSNAVRLLQYEWYARYMNASAIAYGIDAPNERMDAIFEEVVKGTFAVASESLDLEKIPLLIDFIEQSAKDRIFMMWLRDEEGQALVKSYGFSGGLNNDPEKPAVGVFFGNNYGSKLGWWIDMNASVGEGRQLSDGSMEYDVTVSFRNNFNYGDAYYLGYWISGVRMNGILDWYVYVFAPSGGSISSAYIDYWWNPCDISWYNGLQVAYKQRYYFHPQTYSNIYLTVRTAPGVTEKPTVYQTPTLTKYR